MTYTVSTKRYIGNHETIVTHADTGQEIPVMHIIQGATDFPADSKQLASNIASLMNGHKTLYRLDLGNDEVFWKRNSQSFELRLKGDNKNLTQASSLVISLPKADEYDIDLYKVSEQLCQLTNNKTAMSHTLAPHTEVKYELT